MQLTDRRGLEVSSRNPDSLERFEEAMDLTVSYFVDPLAIINSALEQDPAFAMGHCLRAALGVMSSERGALPMVRESVEAVEAQGARANDRERAHAASARRWMEGDFAGAVRRLRRDRRRPPARPARAAGCPRRRLLPRPVLDAA